MTNDKQINKVLGNEKPEFEAVLSMRERGGEWFAYQNHDLGHSDLGHLKFLRCGDGATYKEPPARLPDGPDGSINWRYLLVGEVDLKTGEIKEVGS